MKITPDTKLEVGTKVRIQNELGIVVKVSYVSAIPYGMIYVHTIKFTHKVTKVRDKNGKTARVDVPIKVSVRDVNYSYIEVL